MKNKPLFNKSRLRSAIRREWLYSELRKLTLARARKSRGVYSCEKCSKLVGPKEIEVNHKQQCTPENGLNTGVDWGIFIDRLLYCTLDQVEAICSECHKQVTDVERSERAEKKAKSKPKKS